METQDTIELHSSGPKRPVIIFLTPDPEETSDYEHAQYRLFRHSNDLQALGANVLSMPWSKSPALNHSSYTYVANLVWGYHLVPDRWNAWLHAWPKTAHLINSASLLRWNTRKTYLQDLDNATVPIIPTLFVDQIEESTFSEAAKHFSTKDMIVKPQLSASSHNTLRVLVDSDNFAAAPKSISVSDAISQLKNSGATKSMMIQPFMKNVNDPGEVSVFVFGGQVTHAVLKTAASDDYRVQCEFGGKYTLIEHPSLEMIDLAKAAIAACPEFPVYARVDMLRNDRNGLFSVSELELIEPELCFDYEPTAGMAFARAVFNEALRNFE